MNNRRAIKQKKKSRDNQIIETLEKLEKDLKDLKLMIQKKDKQLGQYDRVLKEKK